MKETRISKHNYILQEFEVRKQGQQKNQMNKQFTCQSNMKRFCDV